MLNIQPKLSDSDNTEFSAQQFQCLEDENRAFSCEICVEPMVLRDRKFNNTNKCSHPFCTDCSIKYIQVKLNDDKEGNIKCPCLNCDQFLDPVWCRPLIGESLFVRWTDVLCEWAIVEVDKCYCPDWRCNVLILNECGGKLKKSKCPNCNQWFCFQCKKIWHAGFGCEESGELRDKNDMEFGRLVEMNGWKRCPLCRHFVERTQGCRIMTCRCGTRFCYKCGKQPDQQHRCDCDYTYPNICVWCVRIFILLCFLYLGIMLAPLIEILAPSNHAKK